MASSKCPAAPTSRSAHRGAHWSISPSIFCRAAVVSWHHWANTALRIAGLDGCSEFRCAQFTATSIIASRLTCAGQSASLDNNLAQTKVHAVLLSLPFNQIQPRVTNVLPKIRSADPIPCPSTPARHAARIHCRRDRSANRSLAPPESVSNGRWVNLPAFPTGFPTHTSTICCRRDRSTNHSLLQSGLPSSVPRQILSREQLSPDIGPRLAVLMTMQPVASSCYQRPDRLSGRQIRSAHK